MNISPLYFFLSLQPSMLALVHSPNKEVVNDTLYKPNSPPGWAVVESFYSLLVT